MRAASLMLMLTLLLGACGFHLRGEAAFSLPFHTLYVKSNNELAPFILELKRGIEANGVEITDTPEQAQLTLHIVSESTDRQIMSLSGSGRVLEYRLYYRVSFQAYDNKHRDWLAPDEITLRRDYSYDATQVIAKEQEEALLYQNMRSDAVHQMLRRLNHVKAPDEALR